jgi:hypothetical protein
MELDEPMPLLEKGAYNMDEKLRWLKRDDLDTMKNRARNMLKPTDAVAWFEEFTENDGSGDETSNNAALKSKNAIVDRKASTDSQLVAPDHHCVKDRKHPWCWICGATMDNNYNLGLEITPLNLIYPDPIFQIEEPRGQLTQKFSKPATS